MGYGVFVCPSRCVLTEKPALLHGAVTCVAAWGLIWEYPSAAGGSSRGPIGHIIYAVTLTLIQTAHELRAQRVIVAWAPSPCRWRPLTAVGPLVGSEPEARRITPCGSIVGWEASLAIAGLFFIFAVRTPA